MCQCVYNYITVQFTQLSGIMLCSLYVLFSLILYNDNVNIGGDMKFSGYSSLYCLHILRFIGGNIYNGEFPTLRMEALILTL